MLHTARPTRVSIVVFPGTRRRSCFVPSIRYYLHLFFVKSVFITLFTLFVAGESFSQQCQLRLSGHVEDADTKDKLLSATVVIIELNRQIITDEKGDFVFDSLCAGKYT